MIEALKYLLKRILGLETKIKIKVPDSRPNLVMLTYDSCRYDSMAKASTPVLDQYGVVHRAYSPATYTYPAHQSFFCGLLPGVLEPVPYYNRYVKQLIALKDAGDSIVEQESGANTFTVAGVENIISGLARAGYYTVGSAGANWFAKKSLQVGFKDFYFTNHAPALDQIELVLNAIKDKARLKSFFAFINFMETHTPYMHYHEPEYHMTARKKISWPPCYNPQEAEYGQKLHQAQIKAVEYLDTCLPRLLNGLPKNTIVILLGDHGEAFGEDGYWGHGVYHEKVIEVPLSIFTL
jgi:membrane-anchored protein YejM (alkaline phosphatase superfamily)